MERGTNVTLECASSDGYMSWLFGSTRATDTDVHCKSADEERYITSQPTSDSCYLTVLGNRDIHGQYICIDFHDKAQAFIVVIGKLELLTQLLVDLGELGHH